MRECRSFGPSGGPDEHQALLAESLARAERFADLPFLKLRINPDIMPLLLTVLSRARHQILTKQYLMDHTLGFSVLEESIRKHGTRVYILYDHNQYKNSSCRHENARLRSLANVAASVNRSS